MNWTIENPSEVTDILLTDGEWREVKRGSFRLDSHEPGGFTFEVLKRWFGDDAPAIRYAGVVASILAVRTQDDDASG